MASESFELHDAVMYGKVDKVRECLASGADLSAVNEEGYTPMHCTASCANNEPVETTIELIRLLLEAGVPIEDMGNTGVTPLYVMAGLSLSVEPIKYLLDAGADPRSMYEDRKTIIECGMSPEIQQFLAEILDGEVPEPPPDIAPTKLSTKQWGAVKKKLDATFKALTASGLVALQDAGVTQEDGFSDCAEIFHERGGVLGFCYYTRQDLKRAKQTGQLALAFWAAPEGADEDLERVCDIILDTFTKTGFTTYWGRSLSTRPTVYLTTVLDAD